MRNLHSVRRSRWWFALLVVPLLVGTLAVIRAVDRIGGTLDAMVRVEVPGERELELPAGALTIYDEGVGGSMTCALRDADTGAAIALKAPSGRTTYNWGSRHGESVGEFTSPRAGRYVLTCTSPDGTHHTLAIGGGLFWPILGLVAAAFGGLGGTGLAAVGISWWRRRSVAHAPGS